MMWLAAAGVLAIQGQAVQLDFADEPGLRSADVQWDERAVPFVRLGHSWITVIGVDLDAEPGEHVALISKRFEDGVVVTAAEVVEVAAQDFPTTELTVAPGYVELSPENQARAARERREIGEIYATLTPEILWSEPFDVPLPGVVVGINCAHRRVFNGQPRAPHSGADLRAASGTPIFAANRGRVVLAKDLFFSGNAVFLDHGLGVYTVYLHMSEIRVQVGTVVDKGQLLGLAGATGRVTGPHLHWGARVLAARVDPFTLVRLGR